MNQTADVHLWPEYFSPRQNVTAETEAPQPELYFEVMSTTVHSPNPIADKSPAADRIPQAVPNPRFSDLPQHEHSKTLRAAGVGTGQQQTQVQVREFAFIADQPTAVGGRNEGPSPMEYLAGGVNACITVVIEQAARRRGIDVSGIQTYTIAKQDTRGLTGKADVQPYMYAYRLQIVVETAEADTGVLMDFARDCERSCPAINLLRDANTGLAVVWSFVHDAGEGAAEALSNEAWGYESAAPLPGAFHTVVNADLSQAEPGGAS